MMVNFVAGGHGIGLLTRESISPNRSDVSFVPLVDQGAEINLAMVWRGDRMRNTLRSFLSLSREVMAESPDHSDLGPGHLGRCRQGFTPGPKWTFEVHPPEAYFLKTIAPAPEESPNDENDRARRRKRSRGAR